MVTADGHRDSSLGYVSDAFFSNPILEVSIHMAKRHGLPVLCSVVQKEMLGESPIVRMAVDNLDTEGSCAGLERSLSKQRLGSSGQLLEMHERQATEMIDEHCGHLVSLAKEETFVLTNEARDW
jgi:hypothetical protein